MAPKKRRVSVEISLCLARYSCARISALPPQVISRQSAQVKFRVRRNRQLTRVHPGSDECAHTRPISEN